MHVAVVRLLVPEIKITTNYHTTTAAAAMPGILSTRKKTHKKAAVSESLYSYTAA